MQPVWRAVGLLAGRDNILEDYGSKVVVTEIETFQVTQNTLLISWVPGYDLVYERRV
jgi:hypothetical protein